MAHFTKQTGKRKEETQIQREIQTSNVVGVQPILHGKCVFLDAWAIPGWKSRSFLVILNKPMERKEIVEKIKDAF